MEQQNAKKLRVGIVGLGNMGGGHIGNWINGYMPEIDITALCDIDPDRLKAASERVPGAATFSTSEELIRSGSCDAIIIATPHYFHPPIGIDALNNGVHVMSEKPAGVYTKQVRELISAANRSKCTYAIMFNQRTNCVYRKVKQLVASGEFGDLHRVSWIITDWFRTQSYYDSGAWRATWAGEGGGVMLNQCPHQLDLWQWICGMPNKILAVCKEGLWHDIEVEDDVTIYAEYPNGATGTFITTTGDAPGTNRLEITLDKAKIVVIDGDKIELTVLDTGIKDTIAGSKEGFKRVGTDTYEVETDGFNMQHSGVMNAFASHILRGEPLVAEGYEGINGLTISNAAFLSSWLGKAVEIPFDEDLYWEELKKRIATSRAKDNVTSVVETDMSSTY